MIEDSVIGTTKVLSIKCLGNKSIDYFMHKHTILNHNKEQRKHQIRVTLLHVFCRVNRRHATPDKINY